MKAILSLFTLLTCSLCTFSQDFYDLGTVQTIEITFSQSNWDALLDAEKAGNEDYIMAQSVELNGTVFDSVGVKYKGNSTYNANQTKNPFHIELDTYKSQDYQGYKDIKLSNVANDPSFLREVLSYQILGQYMDAPKSNYANVYVNGTLIGLYSNSEAISKTFLENRFLSKNNTFVKCNPPAGAGPTTNDYPNLVYMGTDSSLYYDSYELKSDYGWEKLLNLCDSLDNNIGDIEDVLDVDRAIWMIAFDNMLVNLDSYIGGFAQNYYLYKDDYNRFIPMVWDLNESFGRFTMTGSGTLNSTADKQQMSHLLHSGDANYPLVSQLLSIPMFKRMYLAHCKTMLLENFDDGSYFTTGQTLQTLIDADVQADVNKFYTYANFTTNITTDITSGGGPGGGTSIPGITNLMGTRSSYLLNLSDFTQTQPDITNISESNTTPSINDVISVSADITNETDVYFGYRSDSLAPFTKVLMLDDGLHNDGAANDGTYGVDVTISNTFVQYFIYADNNNIGRFSPARAEHEFYQIDAVTPPVGDLVINEFQASNNITVFDQDGEYDDWIELYNNSSSAIDLTNYYLTDDVSDLTQWAFVAGSSIPANGYFTVWADDDVTQVGSHANFKLSSSGETLFLTDLSGTVVDQVTFGSQNTDETYGRFPNGTGSFQSMSPTYAAENTNVLGIDNTDLDMVKMSIYPNPSNGWFTIEIDAPMGQADAVNIYNMLGVLIYKSTISQSLTVNTEEWSSGMYLVRIGGQSTKITIK